MIWAVLILCAGIAHVWRTKQGIRLRRELEEISNSKTKDDKMLYRQHDIKQMLNKLPEDSPSSYVLGIAAICGGAFILVWIPLVSHLSGYK